jgi:Fe2+ or Zn2+ uptake regulation protein
MDLQNFLETIKQSGLRMTPARTGIIKLFILSKNPITAVEMQANIQVNKTTVYRELNVLLEHGYISEVDFGDGIKRYELSALGHHHHLICTKCRSIADIELDHDFTKEQFTVLKHNLEFFGVCRNCI